MSATSTEGNHVAAIVDLFSEFAEDPANWTNDPPSVKNYWDVPNSEKQSMGVDLPTRIYVWSPTSTQLPQFSADGNLFDRQSTAEMQIWDYDAQAILEYQSDVVQLLSDYFADTTERTQFVDIRPVNASDFREQNNPKQDEPYIVSVEVSLRALDETLLAE